MEIKHLHSKHSLHSDLLNVSVMDQLHVCLLRWHTFDWRRQNLRFDFEFKSPVPYITWVDHDVIAKSSFFLAVWADGDESNEIYFEFCRMKQMFRLTDNHSLYLPYSIHHHHQQQQQNKKQQYLAIRHSDHDWTFGTKSQVCGGGKHQMGRLL